MYDFVIIGSGIIGTLIARALSRFDVRVLVLEKENDVANHQTIANSAIIHSGHDPIPNTLKAELCVKGNALYDTLEKTLGIHVLRTGGMVVSTIQADDEQIDMLYDRAIANKVPGVTIMSKTEILDKEPRLTAYVSKGLWLPTTKVVYPWEVAIAALEDAMLQGVVFRKNSEVTSIRMVHDIFDVEVNRDEIIKTRSVISAAGVFSDQIASMIEKDVHYKITPRKGEYFVLDRRVKGLFKHVIYPIPSALGKGVLIVPQVHGNLLIGPTSSYIDDKSDHATTKEGLSAIKKNISALTDHMPFDQIIRSFSGLRATSTYEDFYIKESTEYANFFHVAGIDSPGLTAAPAIAEYLVHDVMKLNASPRKDIIRYQKPLPLYHERTEQEKAEAILTHPTHGNLICKCEKVTEQDIIEQIHRPLGGETIKGIRKRARAGSGLCQGGFCESLVLDIIAREKRINPLNVTYDGLDTPILIKETKVSS